MRQFSNDLEMTFQLSLDHFLQEQEELQFDTVDEYQAALDRLELMKQVRSPLKRHEIAQQVIEKCPHCVEAHLAVSLYAKGLDERLHALQQASQLSAIRLGRDYFVKDVQDYYRDQETHLFFRSKTAYALALFEAGFMRKARPHFELIKRLNPSDIFHVSHYLLSVYLLLEDMESGYAILQNMDEHDAFTCYSKALYSYKDMEFDQAKHWLLIGKQLDLSIYQLLCTSPLPFCKEKDETPAEHFLTIYEKPLTTWHEFSDFVKAI